VSGQCLFAVTVNENNLEIADRLCTARLSNVPSVSVHNLCVF